MSTQKTILGGQAFPMGVLIRGKRNAAAFRKKDGGTHVKTWPAENVNTSDIPVIRGVTVMFTAMAEGLHTTVEAAKMAKDADISFPYIKKLRQYHGAEHKTIACYESGKELTVENVRSQSRIHPRCGTVLAVTALFTQSVLSAAIPKSLSPQKRQFADTAVMLLSLGLSYELSRMAWKDGNKTAKALTAPGRWAQAVTTAEPDDDAIRCAIEASKAAIE